MPKQTGVRSPRFIVPNNEQAFVSVNSEHLKGTLQLLSLTGGTIRLDRRFSPGTFADIRMETASGAFTAAIEFLRMGKNNAQAFRFVAMGTLSRNRLSDGLKRMREQGHGLEKTPMDHFRTLARRVLPRSAR